MKAKTEIIIFIVILMVVTSFVYFFATPEGLMFVHKKTNLVCKFQYDEDLDSWGFEANSTEINRFIEECKDRGIGVREAGGKRK